MNSLILSPNQALLGPSGYGPLGEWERARLRVLADVVSATVGTYENTPLDVLLGEALYSERQRLKRERPNLFTKARHKQDVSVWNQVQAGLLKSPVETDRKMLLRLISKHYAEEIGAHFDPKVYGLATRLVPWFFNWMFNAASVRRFLPWGLRAQLTERMRITGEVAHLRSLASKGTILLVPTHQSNLDSVLIGYIIYLMGMPPFSYGAGLNLFSNPLLSFFMSNLGAYTVDRRKSNAIYKESLKNYSARILQEGVHSIFFPGGGRCRSGAVESKLKLGLLGTALEAQIHNLREGKERPNVYVVPMVLSYHFVLEASSLIEDYLAEAGKARFIITDDESFQPKKIINFFWKFFASQSSIMVRVGKPLDVFGNFVDDAGRSLGPNGTTIDPARWLTTGGELRSEPRRDMEYTRELGARLVDRYHRENTVLTSHVVAFSLFEALRTKYPDLDLYRFLRLSSAQRAIPKAEYYQFCEHVHEKLGKLEMEGQIYLSNDLKQATHIWVDDGLRQLGLFHDAAVVRQAGDAFTTDDLNLLYYYRNRLTGYGISFLAGVGEVAGKPGAHDRKGFLA